MYMHTDIHLHIYMYIRMYIHIYEDLEDGIGAHVPDVEEGCPDGISFRAKRQRRMRFQGFLPDSKGQNILLIAMARIWPRLSYIWTRLSYIFAR